MQTDKQAHQIETIKKLLNFTADNGATENEVMIALQKAALLMKKYNISEEDVDNATKNESSNFVSVRLANDRQKGEMKLWLRRLTSTVARLYHCKITWYTRMTKKSGTDYYTIIGTELDTQLVVSTMKTLIPIVRLLKNAAYENYCETKISKIRRQLGITIERSQLNQIPNFIQKNDFTISYMIGFSESIYEIIRKNEEADKITGDNAYGLMCLNKLELIDNHLSVIEPNLNIHKERKLNVHEIPYYQGLEDGNENFFNQQQLQ